jgi:hypothetical protein
MGHDTTKILMGTTPSIHKEGVTSTDHTAAVADFPAGTCCRLKSDSTLSKTKLDGNLIGVSMGRSMSDTTRTVVIRAGLRVPVLLTDTEEIIEVKSAAKIQDITYTSKLEGVLGDDITIIYTDTKEDGSAEATVANDTEITVEIEDGVTTAATIKTAIEAGDADDLVSAAVDSGDETDVQASFAEAIPLEGGVDGEEGEGVFDYVEIGGSMYVDDVTCKATESGEGTTITAGIYATEAMTGIAEDGTEVYVALVDMIGSL